MSKHKNKDPKAPKQIKYTLPPEEISELSFITQNERTNNEQAFYWQKRFEALVDKIKKRLAIGENFTLDLSHLWSESQIIATELPKPKIESPSDAKPELPKKP